MLSLFDPSTCVRGCRPETGVSEQGGCVAAGRRAGHKAWLQSPQGHV